MRNDKLIVLAALVLAVLYCVVTEQINTPPIGDPIGPKAIPRLLNVILVLAAGLLWLETRSKSSQQNVIQEPNGTGDRTGELDDAEKKKSIASSFFIASLVAGTLVYLLLFQFLGYAISTAIYLYILMLVFNPGQQKANVLTSVGFSIFSYLAFTRLFGAQLPAGLLPF